MVDCGMGAGRGSSGLALSTYFTSGSAGMGACTDVFGIPSSELESGCIAISSSWRMADPELVSLHLLNSCILNVLCSHLHETLSFEWHIQSGNLMALCHGRSSVLLVVEHRNCGLFCETGLRVTSL